MWVKASEKTPGKGNYVYCKDSKGCKYVCVYANKYDLEIGDYDGDQDESTADFLNDRVFMKPGWYESCEQIAGEYDSVYLKRDIVEWFDESASIPIADVTPLVEAINTTIDNAPDAWQYVVEPIKSALQQFKEKYPV